MSFLRYQHIILLILFSCTIISSAASSNDFNESAVVEKILATDPKNQPFDCLALGLDSLLMKRGYNSTNGGQEKHHCRLRNFQPIPQHLWNFVAGGMCINFTPTQRFNNRDFVSLYLYTCAYLSSDGIYHPVRFTVVDKTIVFFDYRNQADLPLIRTIFRPDHAQGHLQRFIECAEEADFCCSNVMNAENVALSEENPCPATWDGWSCFPSSEPGTTERVVCPRHSYSSSVPCIEYSERYCLEEGGWNQITNHLICSAAGMVRRRLPFYIYALIVSTALCLPAIVIYFSMRKVSLRIILHRNLLIAVVVKNILTIMSNWIVQWENVDPYRNSTEDSILERSPGGCKFLAYLENVSLNFIFTWMLIEAFYLHKTIVRVFSKDPSIVCIYVFVIVCSIIPSTIWAILMASAGREECWMVDTETSYQWVTDGYRLGILIINTLLLLDIIRVFVFKISQHASLDQVKSSIKVILFLILLFGIPLLIIGQDGIVDTTYCANAMVYHFVMYTIEALQGVIIAILFCYLNKEVHKQLRQIWKRLSLRLCGHRFTARSSNTSNTVLTKDRLSSAFGKESTSNVEKK